ncbi:hypothetical protein BDV98DRAFT_608856 [Pterulicium gracile]|uniref:Actin-like ATPase domain-containing protein n=1 Tax=Pterulicium gracile TaxID=1884261 RepID=A0A5C3Q233_9AGAR|nr:hypothetical protein BDV98DRAFT_608856 [Pterula gracilis]
MYEREAYAGTEQRLVLAFDLGTIFSGVSYCILNPGVVPEIEGVNRYPAHQEYVGRNCKIPSVIYYDQYDVPRACGAETLQPSVVDEAEEHGWVKVEWFKLHLRPKTMKAFAPETILPSLPGAKLACEVLADFFGYLFRCARTYIQEAHDEIRWETLEDNIHFVFSHPNGWGGPQQKVLRKAAVLSKLIADDEAGHFRMQFVTEGEASLNYCIHQGFVPTGASTQFVSKGAIVVDAGGGTINMSAYSLLPRDMRFEEIAESQCVFQGSAFVTQRAKSFFQAEFMDSSMEGDIPQMVEAFDKLAKVTFANETSMAYVKFGRLRDNDPKRNVRNGKLAISGSRVAGFFRPSFDAIMDAIVIQIEKARSKEHITVVYLVGGFAASEWLFRSLSEHLRFLGITVFRPDKHSSKAVADGAVSFYIDKFVKSRIAKHTYGLSTGVLYNPNNPEQLGRTLQNGICGLNSDYGAFSTVLSKGSTVQQSSEARTRHWSHAVQTDGLDSIKVNVYEFSGESEAPRWMDRNTDFKTAFTVRADTKNFRNKYWRSFQMILVFEAAELKAQVCWIADGKEVRSPAQIIYHD